MNRICAIFDNISYINMNAAGVPPFNGQMFLSGPVSEINEEAVELFERLDMSNLRSIIEGESMMDIVERYKSYGYDALKELITEKLTNLCGSIENAYPSIAYVLFVGDNKDKAIHKQMFWRVFGDIALRNLKANLLTATLCPHCGAKVPLWVKKHTCLKAAKGFFTCEDCGKWCQRTNSRQRRCKECQQEYRRASVYQKHLEYRMKQKESAS